ncbi:MAG: PorV/PorQ family protein [Calditrichaeota bacterium]|nr:MAG: PorV/PorQ family protein [Calditrichota bacterium]
MKKTMLVSFIWLLIVQPLAAQKITKVGTTAARFLNIDVGARAVGMGGAYTTLADDPSALYWNPAGLALFKNNQVTFNHMNWLADVNLDFAALAVPLHAWGTLGIAATFMTMGEMEVTTVSQPMGTGEQFDAGSYVFSLGYGNDLTDRFSIGGNLKYIHENIYHCNAAGIAFDIGTLFKTQFYGMTIGAAISNYGAKMRMSGRDLLIQADVNPQISGNNENINANLQTDAYDLPLIFRVGIGVDVLKGAGNSNLYLAVDAMHPNDDTESINLGAEYGYKNLFFLRGGYKSLFAKDSEDGLSLGVGLRLHFAGLAGMEFDYAFQDFGILNNIQMFSIGLGF